MDSTKSSKIVELKVELDEDEASKVKAMAEMYSLSTPELLHHLLRFLSEPLNRKFSELSEQEVVRLLIAKDGEIASLKFQNYDLYRDNKILSMRLSGCDAMVAALSRLIESTKEQLAGGDTPKGAPTGQPANLPEGYSPDAGLREKMLSKYLSIHPHGN